MVLAINARAKWQMLNAMANAMLLLTAKCNLLQMLQCAERKGGAINSKTNAGSTMANDGSECQWA